MTETIKDLHNSTLDSYVCELVMEWEYVPKDAICGVDKQGWVWRNKDGRNTVIWGRPNFDSDIEAIWTMLAYITTRRDRAYEWVLDASGGKVNHFWIKVDGVIVPQSHIVACTFDQLWNFVSRACLYAVWGDVPLPPLKMDARLEGLGRPHYFAATGLDWRR